MGSMHMLNKWLTGWLRTFWAPNYSCCTRKNWRNPRYGVSRSETESVGDHGNHRGISHGSVVPILNDLLCMRSYQQDGCLICSQWALCRSTAIRTKYRLTTSYRKPSSTRNIGYLPANGGQKGQGGSVIRQSEGDRFLWCKRFRICWKPVWNH